MFVAAAPSRRTAPAPPTTPHTDSESSRQREIQVRQKLAKKHKGKVGRISLQPAHITNALDDDDRYAVAALEHHLWLRNENHSKHDAIIVVADGQPGTFLTVKHIQRCLGAVKATKTGEHHAAKVINEILPRLGLIKDTRTATNPGEVMKPVVHNKGNKGRYPNQGPERTTGGRNAQPSTFRSFWWRCFSLTSLRIAKPRAYGWTEGLKHPRPSGSACLYALAVRQGLISTRTKRRFSPGSVQEAFAVHGPP